MSVIVIYIYPMKKIFFVLFTITTFNLFSQQKFSKEIKFISDNDLYISFEKDRYYTNGMFLSYSYVAKTPKLATKKIHHWSLNHKMYTPHKAIVLHPKEHDRPFAGYLYGNYGFTNVYKNNHLLKTSLSLGILGPSAGGEGLQLFIHDLYNFDRAVGWKYQIEDTFGLNANASYFLPLNKEASTSFDIYQVLSANVGTIFNDVSAGLYSRIGFKPLAKTNNSIAFDTHLNNDSTGNSRAVESFLFFNPMLSYIIYDATLEGSLFHDDSLITADPNKVRFQMELGYKFTSNKWVLGYSYILHTQEAKKLRHKWNDYGKITLAFLFN